MSRHIKSRSGCRVCKAKRLKCDETQPACRNCTNRGIACPGYRQVLRWSTKYETGLKQGEAAAASSAANFPQFSQLASAASRSIKPPRGGEPAIIKHESPAPPPEVTQQAQGPISQAPLSPPNASLPPYSKPLNDLGDPLLPYSSPSPSSIISSTPAKADAASSWRCTSYGGRPFSAGSAVAAQPRPLAFESAEETSQDDDNTLGSDGEEFTLELWQPGRQLAAGSNYSSSSSGTMLDHHPARGLALPGTSLVELWFRSVCGMWAAFDSPANPFRRLCAALWSSNEAVFFALQTMAAASLPRRPPSVREIVVLAPQMSTQALIHELQELFAGATAASATAASATASTTATTTTTTTTSSAQFPAGLLASLFCMSSSLSWIDARQLGIQYLRNARSVIDLLDMQAARLSAADRELLEFFRGCLLYEEMLRSLVSDDPEDIRALLDWTPPGVDDEGEGEVGSDPSSSSSSSSSISSISSLALHPWVGVPVVLIGLFGKVMALCRRSRKAWRQMSAARATYQGLYQAMLDIQEGRQLEERLLAIDVQRLIARAEKAKKTASKAKARDDDGAADGADSVALKSHLYTAAEAFRLCALLQLYQTFPDLMAQHHQHASAQTSVPTNSGGGGGGSGGSQWLMLLVLHIINLLAEIPPTSPMRCLQPLLCLAAGSALRQDMALSPVGVDGSSSSSPAASSLPGQQPCDLTLFSGGRGIHGMWTGPHAIADVVASSLSGSPPTIEPTVVHLARSTIRERLALLEQNLPPRPIVVARQLLETVWATYDKEVPPQRSHWMDIMSETNFESVFG